MSADDNPVLHFVLLILDSIDTHSLVGFRFNEERLADTWDKSIAVLELKMRTYGALTRADIQTVGDLFSALSDNPGALAEIPKLGRESMIDLLTRLLVEGYIILPG